MANLACGNIIVAMAFASVAAFGLFLYIAFVKDSLSSVKKSSNRK